MSKKVVVFGEIMLRLSTPDNLRFSQLESFDATYGGGESNVGVSLAHFGRGRQLRHQGAGQCHRRSAQSIISAVSA